MPPSVFSSQISSRIRYCHPFSYFAFVIGTQKNLAYTDANTVYRYIVKSQLPELDHELPKTANLPKDFDSMNAKPAKIDWFEFFSETMWELWNAKILNASSGTQPIDTSPLFHHKNEAFLS